MTVLISTSRLEDGLWVTTSDDAPGCWSDGRTKREAENRFCDVLRSWWQLKAEDGDDDLPPCDVTTNGEQR